MDILQTFLKLLSEGREPLRAIIKLLSDNSFDIKKTIANLTPENVSEILSEIEKSRPQTAENGTFYDANALSPQGLAPISDLADKEVVFALNKYLSSSYE